MALDDPKGILMVSETSQPKLTITFIPLTPELEESYDEIRTIISEIASRPYGLALILNAIATTGDSSAGAMALWTDLLIEAGWDTRDLAGLVRTRPIDLPSFTD